MPSYVYIQNNVQSLSLSVDTDLAPGTYSLLTPTAPAAQTTRVLTVNRDVGITSGQVFWLALWFSLGAARCRMHINLLGTPTSSDMSGVLRVDLLGHSFSTQTVEDTGTFELPRLIGLTAFNGTPLNFRGTLTRSRTPLESFDDFTVNLTPN